MAYYDSDTLEEIQQVVEDAEEPITSQQVVEQTDVSTPTALRYLKHLARQGKINKKGTGTSLEWYIGEYHGEKQ